MQSAARTVQTLREQRAALVTRTQARRVLPDAGTTDKILRYENHLQRQLIQALHELERLKAARSSKDSPPPAALDVNVSGDQTAGAA